MITGKQIRAARVLLDWDAEDLADKSGLNRETIFNIERGTVQARPGTLEKIVRAFSDHRVEFLEDQGVRYKPDDIQVLIGQEGLITLLEDVYNACRRGVAGKIVISGISEDDFEKHLGAYDEKYLAKMGELSNVSMRHIIAEGDHKVISNNYSEYRWTPRAQFKAVPFYVYADKLAIILFSSRPSPKIFVIQSIDVADAYRLQFEGMWKQAKPIPLGETER